MAHDDRQHEDSKGRSDDAIGREVDRIVGLTIELELAPEEDRPRLRRRLVLASWRLKRAALDPRPRPFDPARAEAIVELQCPDCRHGVARYGSPA